jgi:hypothetical protein
MRRRGNARIASISKTSGLCWHIIRWSVFVIFLGRIFNPGEDFEFHRSQIHVVQSAMQFGERGVAQSPPAPTVTVVGTIQNDSAITWKDAILEAQFFDRDRKLIDAKQQRDYSEVLTTGAPCAFKVSMPREFDAGKYVSYEIRVVSARDGRGIFP